MKGKILLFDIDETIFNPESFLNDFYEALISDFKLETKDIQKIRNIYQQTKNEQEYFSPTDFISKIIENFSSINRTSLEKVFWNIDLFNKNVYKDASVIKDLSRLASIGIFSKGDEHFQKQKISFMNDFLDSEDVYIFKNKLKKINEILENYPDQDIYIVDNEIDVLDKIKSINPEIYTILIDRKNKYEDLDIIKIKNLNELKSLIYD